MKLKESKNGVLLSDVPNFDPFMSFECGQCFRFRQISDDAYSFISGGDELTVRRVPEGWLFEGIGEKAFADKWFDFFDLGRDYGKIIESFTDDATISRAATLGSGIRIFRQEPWETLISFIISQNNNIPRIKKIIASLCALLGEAGENGVYSFPTADRIAEAGIDGLAPIRSGFRAKYILDAADKVLSGEVSLKRVASSEYGNALAELKLIKGVGDKVANCVLLFGFGFYEAFPVDVWVKRVLEKYYGNGFDAGKLGKYAGIAQQYLFYYERSIASKQKQEVFV